MSESAGDYDAWGLRACRGWSRQVNLDVVATVRDDGTVASEARGRSATAAHVEIAIVVVTRGGR